MPDKCKHSPNFICQHCAIGNVWGPVSAPMYVTPLTYGQRIWDYPRSLLDKSNKRIDIKIRHTTLDSDFGAYITTDKGEEIDITAKSLDELFNLITLRFP